MDKQTKALKILKYLKKHNFDMAAVEPKVALLLEEDSVLNALNANLPEELKLYRTANLYRANIVKITEQKYDQYNDTYSYNCKTVNKDAIVYNKTSSSDRYVWLDKRVSLNEFDRDNSYAVGTYLVSDLKDFVNILDDAPDFMTRKDLDNLKERFDQLENDDFYFNNLK